MFKKITVAIFTVILCLSLAGCNKTEKIDLPFELSEIENIEMFHFIDPMDAEKKVITEQEDIEDIYTLLESISLKDKKTEPVAGGSTTSFRFNLSDGTDYEITYSEIAVKSGRIVMSDNEKDYFTSADIEAIWNNSDYTVEEATENELPIY